MAEFIDYGAMYDREAGESVNSTDEKGQSSDTDSSGNFVSQSATGVGSKSNKHR